MKQSTPCLSDATRVLLRYGTDKTLREASTLYIYVILLLFPFYATDQYFRLLRDRTAFFTTATMMLVVCVIFLYLKLLVMLMLECIREGGQLNSLVSELRSYITSYKPSYTVMDRCMLCFLFISALSTLFSQYHTEAFWGNEGRYQGMFLWFLYGAAYFIISRYAKPTLKMMQVFLIGGVISALWGITNFLGMDPFHWLELVKEEQRGIFVSSYGNINTYTATMSIFMAIAGTLYIMASEKCSEDTNWKIRELWYPIAFFLLCVALITGRSDNAALAIIAFFIMVPFFTWNNPIRIMRHSYLCALFGGAMVTSSWLALGTKNPYIQSNDGILLRLCNDRTAMLFICISGILWIMICTVFANRQTDYAKKIWAGLIMTIIPIGFLGVAALRNHPVLLNSAIGQFLHFSDSWGSHRGYIWRAAIEEFENFTLKDTLIGTGPETFGLVMKNLRYDEMKAITGQVFDSPHNEFLQYLFTTGILGAVSYYSFLISGLVHGIKTNTSLRSAAAVAIAVYTVTSFVNISVPITQPYIIILAAFLGTTETAHVCRNS